MRKRAALDRLFVPPDEMRVFMGHVLGLVEQRAYDIFKNRGSLDGHDFDDWVQAESELFQPVTAELSDAGNAFIAVAAVARYRPEDLRVSVESRCLTICGFVAGNEKKSDSSDDHTQPARFRLSFSLPADVIASAASADFRSDVLEVRLPKSASQTGSWG